MDAIFIGLCTATLLGIVIVILSLAPRKFAHHIPSSSPAKGQHVPISLDDADVARSTTKSGDSKPATLVIEPVASDTKNAQKGHKRSGMAASKDVLLTKASPANGKQVVDDCDKENAGLSSSGQQAEMPNGQNSSTPTKSSGRRRRVRRDSEQSTGRLPAVSTEPDVIFSQRISPFYRPIKFENLTPETETGNIEYKVCP